MNATSLITFFTYMLRPKNVTCFWKELFVAKHKETHNIFLELQFQIVKRYLTIKLGIFDNLEAYSKF